MQENRNEDVIEIDLVEIFFLLLSRWLLILLSAILAGIIGFAVSTFIIEDEFQSTTEIYILNNSNSDNVTYTDLQMGTQLTKDYAHLITTRDVLQQVIEELRLEEGYGSLRGRVSVQTPSDTRIVAITVTDNDPAMAQAIANKVREVASEHITNVMAIDAVNVASVANYPTSPSSPNVRNWTLIAFLIGGVLCAGVILLKYLLDDTIKTSDDVERYLNLSTLGMIPINDEEEAKKESQKRRHSRQFTQNNIQNDAQYDTEDDTKADTPADNARDNTADEDKEKSIEDILEEIQLEDSDKENESHRVNESYRENESSRVNVSSRRNENSRGKRKRGR